MKNFIVNKIKAIYNIASMDDNKNIQKKMQELALIETCKYIKDNWLTKLHTVDDKFKLLDLGISKINNFDWLFLEFWVFKWETINYISNKIKSNTIYWFDSFEWLPETWRSWFLKWHFSLDNLPKVNNNVVLTKWWFDEVLPYFLKEHQNDFISFLHIDCDLYSSTKTIFNSLKDRIKKWTVIVFDEYWNYSDWEIWEFKAFNEFLKETWNKFEYIWYNEKHEQLAVIIL